MKSLTLFDVIILIKTLELKYNLELTISEASLYYVKNNNIRTIIKEIKKQKKLLKEKALQGGAKFKSKAKPKAIRKLIED